MGKNIQKGTKGITLIALVITIIVLLILAGVTIAQLTGSDSAPAKANEAAQKNAIGEAKDDVQLTAINAQTKGYETAYVGTTISAGSSKEYVGKTVVQELYNKYGASTQLGKATISVTSEGSADASNLAAITGGSITIYTTDFEVVGTVVLEGGTINWGAIEPNVPGVFLSSSSATLNPGGSIELTARLKNASEPITWSGETSNIRLSSTTGKTVTVSVDEGASNGENTTITATSSDGYSDTCTIEVEIVPVEIVQFTAKPAENQMNKNETTTLQIATTDNNGRAATPTSVTYSSTDTSVATVERISDTTNATLTAVGAGTTTISVTVSNGTNPAVTAEFELTVIVAPTPADEDTSYVGYYAYVDGVYGVIYADLLAQETRSGQWGNSNGTWSLPTAQDASAYKTYEVRELNTGEAKFGNRNTGVLTVSSTDNSLANRFYVMEITNRGSSVNWATACNTKLPANSETPTWRLPSKTEWLIFGSSFGITSSNYSSTYGLSSGYWSSTEDGSGDAWDAYFRNGRMGSDFKTSTYAVRLCTTF